MLSWPYGQHKGKEMSTLPKPYLIWIRDSQPKNDKDFKIPQRYKDEAKRILSETTLQTEMDTIEHGAKDPKIEKLEKIDLIRDLMEELQDMIARG